MYAVPQSQAAFTSCNVPMLLLRGRWIQFYLQKPIIPPWWRICNYKNCVMRMSTIYFTSVAHSVKMCFHLKRHKTTQHVHEGLRRVRAVPLYTASTIACGSVNSSLCLLILDVSRLCAHIVYDKHHTKPLPFSPDEWYSLCDVIACQHCYSWISGKLSFCYWLSFDILWLVGS